uniref:(northern house mosquito) hypothetical protein n=1 Tax=Culex pipiens TaxID=7175 RepID=A0A8D8H0S3_CULPI
MLLGVQRSAAEAQRRSAVQVSGPSYDGFLRQSARAVFVQKVAHASAGSHPDTGGQAKEPVERVRRDVRLNKTLRNHEPSYERHRIASQRRNANQQECPAEDYHASPDGRNAHLGNGSPGCDRRSVRVSANRRWEPVLPRQLYGTERHGVPFRNPRRHQKSSRILLLARGLHLLCQNRPSAPAADHSGQRRPLPPASIPRGVRPPLGIVTRALPRSARQNQNHRRSHQSQA